MQGTVPLSQGVESALDVVGGQHVAEVELHRGCIRRQCMEAAIVVANELIASAVEPERDLLRRQQFRSVSGVVQDAIVETVDGHVTGDRSRPQDRETVIEVRCDLVVLDQRVKQ